MLFRAGFGNKEITFETEGISLTDVLWIQFELNTADGLLVLVFTPRPSCP